LIDLDYCRPLDQISQSHMVLLMLPARGIGGVNTSRASFCRLLRIYVRRHRRHTMGYSSQHSVSTLCCTTLTYHWARNSSSQKYCSPPAAYHQGCLLSQSHGSQQPTGFTRRNNSISASGVSMVVFPLMGVLASTASKSCVGCVAASRGKITSANNSTSIGCASQNPAGYTYGGEGTIE
jgi:hypothetical protein